MDRIFSLTVDICEAKSDLDPITSRGFAVIEDDEGAAAMRSAAPANDSGGKVGPRIIRQHGKPVKKREHHQQAELPGLLMNTPVRAPKNDEALPDTDRAILRLARAMAREAARGDYEQAQHANDNHETENSDLREILDRSSK